MAVRVFLFWLARFLLRCLDSSRSSAGWNKMAGCSRLLSRSDGAEFGLTGEPPAGRALSSSAFGSLSDHFDFNLCARPEITSSLWRLDGALLSTRNANQGHTVAVGECCQPSSPHCIDSMPTRVSVRIQSASLCTPAETTITGAPAACTSRSICCGGTCGLLADNSKKRIARLRRN